MELGGEDPLEDVLEKWEEVGGLSAELGEAAASPDCPDQGHRDSAPGWAENRGRAICGEDKVLPGEGPELGVGGLLPKWAKPSPRFFHFLAVEKEVIEGLELRTVPALWGNGGDGES